MLGSTTSNEKTITPAHEDFRWIHGPGQQNALADFVELTRDISAGVNTCLQIIFASDLVREQNEDIESECASAPAIGKADANNLSRLSIAATRLLLGASQERIDRFNIVSEK